MIYCFYELVAFSLEGRALAYRLYAKKDRKVNYNFVPMAVFSQPEIAFVGLTEEKAREKLLEESKEEEEENLEKNDMNNGEVINLEKKNKEFK